MTDTYIPTADDHASIVRRVLEEQDTQRMKVNAALLNVFNYAIQEQAKRTEWTPSDYWAFLIALDAIDSIGVEAKKQVRADVLQKIDEDIRAAVGDVKSEPEPEPEAKPALPQVDYSQPVKPFVTSQALNDPSPLEITRRRNRVPNLTGGQTGQVYDPNDR